MAPKYRHYSIATTVVVLFFLLLPNGRSLLQYFVDDGWKESLTKNSVKPLDLSKAVSKGVEISS